MQFCKPNAKRTLRCTFGLVTMVVLSVLLAGAGCADQADGQASNDADQANTKQADANAQGPHADILPINLTKAQWRKKLTDQQFNILREAGTEQAFDNPYWDNKRPGLYRCAGCGQLVFSSQAKFKSGTGWPSFTKPIAKGQIREVKDTSFGMVRTEVVCSRCGGHLGHLFHDGPSPTHLRYCLDSAALKFQPAQTK